MTELPEIARDTRPSQELSLREAIEAALANNIRVSVRKLDVQSSQYGVVQQESFFDPLLGASGSYGRSKSEVLSDFSATGSSSWNGSVSLSQNLEEGADYNISFTSSKDRSLYVPAAYLLPFFDPASPTYLSGMQFNFTQPLLRRFGFSANRTEIEVAKVGVGTSQEVFRQTVIDTLAEVQAAYWDLNAAISNLEVQKEGLGLADDLLALNQKKVEVGTLAPIQITEAEASVASRMQGVILAAAQIRNAEDNLRRIMNVAPDSPDWGMAIKPTDAPPFEPKDVDLDALLKIALEERPEIVQFKNGVRVADLQYRLSQNLRKPQLDAVANFLPRGNNFEPGRFTDQNRLELGDWAESASEVFQATNYTWNVGLNFSVPLGNRERKATEARNKIAYEQSELTLAEAQRLVTVQVRTAVLAVETFKQSVLAARANVVLQRKKVDAEQKRFDNGMSTSFQVLTFQNDLTTALSQEISAITAYNKALVDLGHVTATLPAQSGVTIANPTVPMQD